MRQPRRRLGRLLGQQRAGQCGHDTEYASAVRHLVVPITVAGVTGAKRVTVSAYTSCALGATGATCWGAILQTPEGLARAPDPTRPTRFEPLSQARAMAIGNSCGCALLRDGSVGCFGVGPHGCPSVDPLLELDPLFGGRPMQRLIVGGAGACAAREHGDWHCWRHPLGAAAPDNGSVGVSHYAPIELQTVAFGAAEDVAFGHEPCALDGPSLRCLESNGSSSGDEPSLREHRLGVRARCIRAIDQETWFGPHGRRTPARFGSASRHVLESSSEARRPSPRATAASRVQLDFTHVSSSRSTWKNAPVVLALTC